MSTLNNPDENQQDTLQHDLAYLHALQSQHSGGIDTHAGDGGMGVDDGGMGDTDAALDNLFNTGELPQFDTEVDMQLGPLPTSSYPPMQHGGDNGNSGDTKAEAGNGAAGTAGGVDGELGTPSTGGDGTGSPAVPARKKATSRANMLTRGGACEFCKRRKLKCSADLPKCDACVRLDKECVYSQKKQRSRVRVLEDRLADLEKKLGPNAAASTTNNTPTSGSIAGHIGQTPNPAAAAADIGSSTGMAGLSSTSVYDPELTGTHSFGSPGTFISPASASVVTPAASFGSRGMPSYTDPSLQPVLDLGFTLDIMGNKPEEPDLMTLADAATENARLDMSGGYPWQGMEGEQIAAEILRAVEGGKGVGEKIIRWILQAYLNPPKPFLITDPYPGTSATLARLSPRSSSPLHPSLILSIIYLTTSFLPITVFRTPQTPQIITSLLLPPARAYSAQAYAVADNRLLDVIAGQAIRAFSLYDQGRYLDGWAEASGSAAFAWACGLGKLGGVGQKFLPENQRGKEWEEAVAREEKLREFRFKGTVAPPPTSVKDYQQRIKLL